MKEIKFMLSDNEMIGLPMGRVGFDKQLDEADDKIFASLMDVLEYFRFDSTIMDDVKEVRITF